MVPCISTTRRRAAVGSQALERAARGAAARVGDDPRIPGRRGRAPAGRAVHYQQLPKAMAGAPHAGQYQATGTLWGTLCRDRCLDALHTVNPLHICSQPPNVTEMTFLDTGHGIFRGHIGNAMDWVQLKFDDMMVAEGWANDLKEDGLYWFTLELEVPVEYKVVQATMCVGKRHQVGPIGVADCGIQSQRHLAMCAPSRCHPLSAPCQLIVISTNHRHARFRVALSSRTASSAWPSSSATLPPACARPPARRCTCTFLLTTAAGGRRPCTSCTTWSTSSMQRAA